jgi:hypothetical protein
MAMTAAEFQSNFPADTAVPEPLKKVLAYQNRAKNFYSGRFELTDGGPDTALAWFDKDAEAASHFILFGQVDASPVGFWMYEGRTLKNAPIVLLGSEGGGAVIADSLTKFLSLLAVGADEVGSSLDDEEAPSEELAKFRKWLKKQFRIEPAESVTEAVLDAEANHPSLSKWLGKWQQKHFGLPK